MDRLILYWYYCINSRLYIADNVEIIDITGRIECHVHIPPSQDIRWEICIFTLV